MKQNEQNLRIFLQLINICLQFINFPASPIFCIPYFSSRLLFLPTEWSIFCNNYFSEGLCVVFTLFIALHFWSISGPWNNVFCFWSILMVFFFFLWPVFAMGLEQRGWVKRLIYGVILTRNQLMATEFLVFRGKDQSSSKQAITANWLKRIFFFSFCFLFFLIGICKFQKVFGFSNFFFFFLQLILILEW